MFSKANLLSTLVGTIWGMGGGFLLWGLLADPYLSDHVLIDGLMREPIDMVHLAIGTLIQAFAFASIYRKYGASNYGASSGISFGIWIAILMGLGEGLINYATSNMIDLPGTFVNFGVYIVFCGILGLLTGLIYKKTA